MFGEVPLLVAMARISDQSAAAASQDLLCPPGDMVEIRQGMVVFVEYVEVCRVRECDGTCLAMRNCVVYSRSSSSVVVCASRVC